MTFLGILIDTARLELRLPQDKLSCLQALILEWTGKRACHRKELELFIGHLSHAATVVRQGRTFLRELFAILKVARSPAYFVRLNQEVKADIQWWHCFLHHWNGQSFFPRASPSVHVFSDAAGSFGCGAFQTDGNWFQLAWPDSMKEPSIAVMELIPVVIAASIWGPHWQGQLVCFHSDNVAVVRDVSKGFSADKALIHLLRCLSFFAAFFRFHYTATHISGVANRAADALSCNNLVLFHSLVPQVHARSLVPGQLQELLITDPPNWGSSD